MLFSRKKKNIEKIGLINNPNLIKEFLNNKSRKKSVSKEELALKKEQKTYKAGDVLEFTDTGLKQIEKEEGTIKAIKQKFLEPKIAKTKIIEPIQIKKEEPAKKTYKAGDVVEFTNKEMKQTKKEEPEVGIIKENNFLSSQEILDKVEEINDREDNKKESEEIQPIITEEKTPEVVNIVESAEEKIEEKQIVKTKWETPKITEVRKNSGEDIINETKETVNEEKEQKRNLEKAIEKGDVNEINKIINEIDEKFIISEEKTEEPAIVEIKKEKDLEKELEKTRNEYADQYKRFLEYKKESSSWLKNLGRKIVGSKEKYIPQNLKDFEKNYEKATVEYSKKMYAEKEEELKNSKLSTEEQKAELKRYKANEIYTKVIIEEQSKLNALKADNLPVKEKALWKKALDLYSKEWFDESKSKIKWKNRAAKIAVTTLLTTGIFALVPSGASLGAGALASYAGTRLVRGIAGSITGQTTGWIFERSTKAYNWLFNKKTSTEKRKIEEEELQKLFAEDSFDTSFAKNKKEYSEILEREKKAKRERFITKSLITLVAGGLASYEMGNISHALSADQVLSSDLNKPNIEHTTGEIKTGAENFPKHDTSYNETIKKGFPIEEKTIEFKPEKVEISSKGAIQTIEDLKEKIRTDYGNDFSKAPTSVQEFMKTNSTEEAIKLGMYNPNSPAESMNVLKGSTISFDERGNLSYHDIKTGEDHMLIGEQGDVEKYHGQMLDSDQNTNNIDNNISDDQNPYALPLQEDAINTNIIEQTNLNKLPEYGTLNQENTTINNTVEIDGNTYNLSPEQIAEVNEINKENIDHLFGDKTTFMQDNVLSSDKLTADKMIHLNTEGMTDETKKLVSYLNKLREVTGLNPIEGTLITSPETNNEYITRALLRAQEIGELDKVTL